MARLSDANVTLAREIIARYPKARSAMIPLLHLAQQQDGYVTNEAMAHIGDLVGATAAEVLGTATFYEMFKFEPVGTGTDARPAAIHLLETWIVANASPRADEIAAFISACREQSQQRIVWASYAYALENHVSDELVVRFSQAIAAEFGIASLVPFWSRLPQEMMELKSLLPAQFAFEGHDQRMTNMLLRKVDLAALDSPSRAMWMALLTATASPAEALQILRDRSSRLPRDLLVSYARLAGQLGQEIDYRAAMTALGQNNE